MTIEDMAARGFDAAGDAYERGRPSYPPEALSCLAEELAMEPGTTTVDVAAGTGKLTRLLVPLGAQVVAVEPVAGMRRVLVDQLPGVAVAAGTAEALPLATGSAGAVVVAQAFHWFRVPEALSEIARVLRPGGGLGLVWNDRDASVPWVAELSTLIGWNDRPAPTYHEVDWRAAVLEAGAFSVLEHRQFRLEQPLDVDLLVDRVLSTSFIAACPTTEQAALAVDVRRLVADAGLGAQFSLPYRTDVFWCRRR